MTSVPSATARPIVVLSARPSLCLRLAIGPSNTAPLPAASAAPRRTEQKSQRDREPDGGQRMLLQRILQRLAEMLRHVAQGLAAAFADVRHGLVELVLRAACAFLEACQRIGAARAQEITDLRGELPEIVAQRLHVALDVSHRRRRVLRRCHHKLRTVAPNARNPCRCARLTSRGALWTGRRRARAVAIQRARAGESSAHSGSSPSSSTTRWRMITRPKISSGTDRNVPTGPHSQVQKARLRKTPSGLSVIRRPTTLGVTTWPSSVVSATNRHGATAA